MADDPNKSKEVNYNTAEVSQHKRMAAGEKVDGQKTPSKETKPTTKP